MSSSAGWSPDQQFHESAQEMDKIRRRSQIRRQLKNEFNRLHYNPYKIASHVEILDPAVNRFMAMRATHFQHWKPSWGSFFAWMSCTMIPIFGYGHYLNVSHRNFDKKCRTGEIPIEKRKIRLI